MLATIEIKFCLERAMANERAAKACAVAEVRSEWLRMAAEWRSAASEQRSRPAVSES